MAALQLDTTEIISVRREIALNLTEVEVPDDAITDTLILGSATDFVFERVRENMQISGDAFDSLSDSAKTAITSALSRDTAGDNEITGFINNALAPPQQQQFRRAVMFRLAGLLIPKVSQVLSESAGSIAQRFQNVQWEVRQLSLFARVEEEIVFIRNAFPDDIFVDATNQETISALANYTLFSTTNP